MKKIIVTTAALAIIASTSAFAKTEGNYFGIDLHSANTRARFNVEATSTTVNGADFTAREDSKVGLGVSYKYAHNFGNNIFLAPGIFFERIGTKTVSGTDVDNNDVLSNNSVTFNNRSGVRLDLGYDINDKVAAYVTFGLANVRYKTLSALPENTPVTTHSGTITAPLYGVGVMSRVSDNVSLGFEYNTQEFRVKNYADLSTGFHTKTTIDMYKVTLAYRF